MQMSEFTVHPVLDRLYTIQDAAMFHGFGDALEAGHVRKGEIIGTFTPWDQVTEPPIASRIDVVDIRKAIVSSLLFAPPEDVDNGLHMIAFDDETYAADTSPVMARFVVNTAVGIEVPNLRTLRTQTVHFMMFNFTEQGSALTLEEGDIAVQPVQGVFDSEGYQITAAAFSEISPVNDMMDFITDKL